MPDSVATGATTTLQILVKLDHHIVLATTCDYSVWPKTDASPTNSWKTGL